MKEKEVTSHLVAYLKYQQLWTKSQFKLTTGRIIDLLSLRWLDEYEIEICGYECKGEETARSIERVVLEQVADYQRVIPKVFLVTDTKDVDEARTICRINEVGFILVNDEGVAEIEQPPESRQLRLNEFHFRQLRTIAAMFLAFEDCFLDLLGNKESRKGSNWCSTPEGNHQVQFTSGYDYHRETVYFAVNLENSKRILSRVNLEVLESEISKLPTNYWMKSGVRRFIGRSETTIIETPTQLVKKEDLEYIKDKAISGQVVWLQIGANIWNSREFLPRRNHIERLKVVRQELSVVHEIMARPKRRKGQ